LAYSNPLHPEHKEWLVARRERFYWILGSAKRDCKLLGVEKEMINELRKVLKRNTEKLKT
jgi:hypothetical protein